MLASIVIPAYNAERTLARCLEACLEQSYPRVEVLVVDDGSTDGTAQIAGKYPVRYFRQENRGPAAARNKGAREAFGEILAFTDADCIPERAWIERLAAALDDGSGAAGGTYAIANPESLLARMVHEEIVLRHTRLDRDPDFLGSFNVAFRKEVFDAAGGFDETFTMASGEDNDLSYRLQELGYRLRFVPNARVAHFHPSRLLPYLCTQMHHGFWRVKLYVKHPARLRRGDQYAGLTDLAAPPLASLLLAYLPVLLAAAFVPGALPVAAVPGAALALAFLAVHIPFPLTMTLRTRDPRMLLFLPVSALRTLARAAGMLRGLVFFTFRRKANG